MENKIKTGIPGLDFILKGGLRENSSTLITGAPGTGKSIMALQFIYEGVKSNEPSLYISSEESTKSLKSYAKTLGMDLEKYEKNNILILIEQSPDGKIMSIEAPLSLLKKKKIKRVVLDSLTLFRYVYPQDSYEFRKGVLSFLKTIKESGATLVVTAEKETTDLDSLRYEDQDFLFDGLIILTRIRKGASFERCITVVKIRGQEHLIDVYPVKIGKGGIEVFPKEIPFSLLEKDVGKFGR